MRRILHFNFCGSLLIAAIVFSVSKCNGILTGDFSLELLDSADVSVAKKIAEVHDFEMLQHVSELGNVFHLRHRTACKSPLSLGASHQGKTPTEVTCARDAAALVGALAAHPRVLRAVHQVAEEIDKREFSGVVDADDDMLEMAFKEEVNEQDAQAYKRALSHRKLNLKFNDPHFHLQWHLVNTGQFKGINPGLDLNLLPAWNRGYTGSGVVVTVVDDGVDVRNPDLTRYDPLASADLNNLTNKLGVPIRQVQNISMDVTHGTECAGEIGAAANNGFCGIGVAFNASVGGIRVLDGVVTDLLRAQSVLHNNQYIDVYSCSWGPRDDGERMEMPRLYTARALRLGVETGRHGLGSIFVLACGNGAESGDNCGADGFVNSPYTVAVAALNIYGRTPMYGESCSAIHVAAPVGGRDAASRGSQSPDPQVTTTLVNGGCFDKMSGTSAATPMVSGCIALALQANGNLTWRDVQHLLVRSARVPSAGGAGGWQVNGAGRLVSHHAGFGLLDCSRLVFLAQTWRHVPPQVVCDEAQPLRGSFRVPPGRPLTLSFRSSGCGGSIHRVEHALVTLSMRGMSRRGDAEIWLESPSGTRARLLGPRPKDADSKLGIRAQTFLSLLSWDESPTGRWLLRVRDRGRSRHGRAVVTSAVLRLTGSGTPARPRLRARWLTPAEVAAAFQEQRLRAAGQSVLHPAVAELSGRLTDALAGGGRDAALRDIVRDARDLVARDDADVTDFDVRFLRGKLKSLMVLNM